MTCNVNFMSSCINLTHAHDSGCICFANTADGNHCRLFASKGSPAGKWRITSPARNAIPEFHWWRRGRYVRCLLRRSSQCKVRIRTEAAYHFHSHMHVRTQWFANSIVGRARRAEQRISCSLFLFFLHAFFCPPLPPPKIYILQPRHMLR